MTEATDRYQELEAELERLIVAKQYTSLQAGQVLTEMDRLWSGMAPAEQEACADRVSAKVQEATGAITEPTRVSCTLAVWLQNGPDLLRTHPTITRVEITDRAPVHGGALSGLWFWFHRDTEPIRVATSAPCGGVGYRTEQDALAAFSEACILWARAQ